MASDNPSDETSSPIIGIDLGTTMSACGYLLGGVPTLIKNPLGELLTPSAVAEDPRGAGLCVGRAAKDIAANRSELAALLFKRDIGNESRRAVGAQRLSAVELSAYVLDALRCDAERQLGQTVSRCVVSVPAYFNEQQRFATKCAAELAGMRVERVLNEPTAAALAVGAETIGDDSTFLVFDLGGGTFDVCVMEHFEGAFEVKSVAGESRLGGEDFTAALVDAVLTKVGVHLDLGRESAEYPLLYKRAELLKRRLSSWTEAAITVPPISPQLSDETEVQVSRAEAESAWQSLLDRMIAPCRTALRGAEITPAELDAVILVGGATRLPCVQDLASSVFKCEPTISQEPDLLVAKGAATQAALCAADEAVSDLVVTDVVSHSLGVESAQQRGIGQVSGYFAPVIHRNTVIPVSQMEPFSTAYDFQSAIELCVYEGESRMVSENALIGTLHVDRLPKERAGVVAVEVRFTLDLHGILEVEAYVPATERRYSKVFRRDGAVLGALELAAARERIKILKSVKGPAPRHRELLSRADLLWRESGAEQREKLSLAIARCEDALTRNNVDELTQHFAELQALCDALDRGERW